MLRIALLYLVLCIIAIRPILCDDTTLSDELMLELKEKVPKSRIGRRIFIIRWCSHQPSISPEVCVNDEIRKYESGQRVSDTQINWAMEGVDKPRDLTGGWITECNKECEKYRGEKYKGCKYDCILDKMCRDLPKQVQQVRKRSRRGRQYGSTSGPGLRR